MPRHSMTVGSCELRLNGRSYEVDGVEAVVETGTTERNRGSLLEEVIVAQNRFVEFRPITNGLVEALERMRIAEDQILLIHERPDGNATYLTFTPTECHIDYTSPVIVRLESRIGDMTSTLVDGDARRRQDVEFQTVNEVRARMGLPSIQDVAEAAAPIMQATGRGTARALNSDGTTTGPEVAIEGPESDGRWRDGQPIGRARNAN